MASQYEVYLRRYLNDNGKLWTSEQVDRWALRAEQEICRVHPAVTMRSQLPITEGLALYLIPPAHISTQPSLGINQITYKGDFVTPLSLQQAHELFPDAVLATVADSVIAGAFNPAAFYDRAFYTSRVAGAENDEISSGRPIYWWYSGYNENVIQLYPTPNETIILNLSANRFWDTDIPNYCVIEYRAFSYGTTKPLTRLVRQLIRDFVLAEAFAIEGKGQQIKEAIMLRKRFTAKMELYKTLASNVFVANKHTMNNQTVTSFSKPRPNFGSDLGRRVR